MDSLAALGTSIAASAETTFGVYTKLQSERHAVLSQGLPLEHAYGSHERQKLDLFMPPATANIKKQSLPGVIFYYGGGLVRGAKRLASTQDAIYSNVGFFFSHRGFVTVIPDYRLAGEGGNAIYPDGGEDVGLALQWTVSNVKELDPNKIFLIGNSAGGIHVSTYLWSRDLPKSVARKVPVLAAILVSVPFHFGRAASNRMEVLNEYFKGDLVKLCPLGLRNESDDKTKILIAVAEMDPEDEILLPNRELLALLPINGAREPELFPCIEGHNHLSPFLSLGLGGSEDAWAEDLVRWMRAQVGH